LNPGEQSENEVQQHSSQEHKADEKGLALAGFGKGYSAGWYTESRAELAKLDYVAHR